MNTILITLIVGLIFSNIYLILKIDDIDSKQQSINDKLGLNIKCVELLIEKHIALAFALDEIRKVSSLHNQIILKMKHGNK